MSTSCSLSGAGGLCEGEPTRVPMPICAAEPAELGRPCLASSGAGAGGAGAHAGYSRNSGDGSAASKWQLDRLLEFQGSRVLAPSSSSSVCWPAVHRRRHAAGFVVGSPVSLTWRVWRDADACSQRARSPTPAVKGWSRTRSLWRLVVPPRRHLGKMPGRTCICHR